MVCPIQCSLVLIGPPQQVRDDLTHRTIRHVLVHTVARLTCRVMGGERGGVRGGAKVGREGSKGWSKGKGGGVRVEKRWRGPLKGWSEV